MNPVGANAARIDCNHANYDILMQRRWKNLDTESGYEWWFAIVFDGC